MRIVMPLFKFHYNGGEFIFTENYSLEHFCLEKEVPRNDKKGLSEIDLSDISEAKWSLVANNPNEYFKSEINLLLIAFRIYARSNVSIKWRFCADDSEYSTCLNERFRDLVVVPDLNITEEGMNKVKDGFMKLIEMYQISDRTKNALYFVWRGLCAEKHIDAYILLVCAVEALFSNETAEDNTKTIIKRTQKYLSGIKRFGGDQIKDIYKIRSNMVHGRISHTDKRDAVKRQENLKNLAKVEELVFACMERMLGDKVYLKYANVNEKELFYDGLLRN